MCSGWPSDIKSAGLPNETGVCSLKQIRKSFRIAVIFIKDILKILRIELNRCDFLEIIEIVGFGLVVNAVYGA